MNPIPYLQKGSLNPLMWAALGLLLLVVVAWDSIIAWADEAASQTSTDLDDRVVGIFR